MGLKGLANERQYKTPKLHLGEKAQRIKAERKARSNRYKTLTTKEKLIYEILREYGIEQMQAVGKGYTVDEAIYAQRIAAIDG